MKREAVTWLRLSLVAVLFAAGAVFGAGGASSLLDAQDPAAGWRFGRGEEFPGAQGWLVARDAALELSADFTKGGKYVQAGRRITPASVDTLSLRVKGSAGTRGFTLRLIDGTGQCHQLPIKIEPSGEWQKIVFPVTDYFDKAGTSAALDFVGRYENWGGAKDGKWHQPLKEVFILAGVHVFGAAQKGSLLFSDVTLTAPDPQKAPLTPLVSRILIDGRKTVDGKKRTNGHLFLPEESLDFELGVQTLKELPAQDVTAWVTVRDYWGAEIVPPQKVALVSAGRVKDRYAYSARYTVPKASVELGRYFELQVNVSADAFAPAQETSGFARLPPAETKKFAPREVPFQIRNWDSRIREYFELADRLGHRNIGLWGDSGWDFVEGQGNMWYTGAFAHEVEVNGWKNTTPQEVYRKTFDLVSKHKDDKLWFICQGNEPNEAPERAKEKVEAYEQVYKAAHAAKPDITVVATSVPALDCFFKEGFGKWCDVYDFHVYETYADVRRGVRRYRELGRAYGCEKPVWCTELGLNSQGQTRLAVAEEVVKKITSFFAEGGANVSWFTIQYPDPEGKARGTGGDCHNVFDCKYNLFNPRLDAIMYYAMINQIGVKKFADEVQHANGVQTYLFREPSGASLLVAWKEGARVDCGLSLPTARDIELTRVDGSHEKLAPAKGVVTLGLSGEPVLLRFRDTATKLPQRLAPAAFAVAEAKPAPIAPGGRATLTLTGASLDARDFTAKLPPRWQAAFKQRGTDVVMTVTAPRETEARAARVCVQQRNLGAVCGEIVLTIPVKK